MLGVYKNCISRAHRNCSILMVEIKCAIVLDERCHRNVEKAYATYLALYGIKSLSHNYRGGETLQAR